MIVTRNGERYVAICFSVKLLDDTVSLSMRGFFFGLRINRVTSMDIYSIVPSEQTNPFCLIIIL